MPDDLENELQLLRKRAEQLRAELKVRASTLLAHPTAATHLLAATTPASSSNNTALSPKQRDQLAEKCQKLVAHGQRNTYRSCAGITTFKVRDPDPAAVDGGAVLGVRIEVMRSARFLRPFYVLLNRPWQGSAAARNHLRIHRHTIPAAIPLAGLAARYLPPPNAAVATDAAQQRPRHDLSAFVRRLRRELVRYQNRLGAVSDLRAVVGLERPPAAAAAAASVLGELVPSIEDDREARARQRRTATGIVDIQPVDAAATQIGFEWRDGRVGRLVISPDGEVLRSVVALPDGGRDRVTQHDVFGDCARIEDVVVKLRGPASGA